MRKYKIFVSLLALLAFMSVGMVLTACSGHDGVEHVELQMADFLSLGISEHISGAVAFLTIVGEWIRYKYEIQN